tara:strand:- start:1041 stop:2927 length:1887 start_codon:yes stop_codon:yes gene_type:complete
MKKKRGLRKRNNLKINNTFEFKALMVSFVLLFALVFVWILVYTPEEVDDGKGLRGELGSLGFFEDIGIEEDLVGWWRFQNDIDDEAGDNDGVFRSADITDAESLTDWGPINVGTISLSSDSVEGNYSLNLTATGDDAYVYYNVSGTWDFSNDDYLTFWAKSGTGAEIADGQFFLIGPNYEYYAWNFTYPIDWEQIKVDINSPDYTGGILNLSSVDRVRFDVNTAGNSGLIDDVYLVKDPFVNGKFGKALDFDGNGDYVDLGISPDFDINNGVTISGWFYPKVLGESVGLVWAHPYDYFLVLEFGLVRFITYDPTPLTSLAQFSESNLEENNWNHIVGLFNGTNSVIYLNGVKMGSGTSITRREILNPHLYIGKRPDDAGHIYFNGLIDEVMIFDDALSQTEIFEIYNSSSYSEPRNTPPVFNSTKCDDLIWEVDTNYNLDLEDCWNDEEGDSMTYTYANASNDNLSISKSGNNLTLVPDAGWVGTGYFHIYADDGEDLGFGRIDFIVRDSSGSTPTTSPDTSTDTVDTSPTAPEEIDASESAKAIDLDIGDVIFYLIIVVVIIIILLVILVFIKNKKRRVKKVVSGFGVSGGKRQVRRPISPNRVRNFRSRTRVGKPTPLRQFRRFKR